MTQTTNLIEKVRDFFPDISVPVFVVEAGKDSRADNEYIDEFLSAIRTPDKLKVRKTYPHEHLLLYNAVQVKPIMVDVINWLNQLVPSWKPTIEENNVV